jgi:hypothetical protein
MTNITGAATTEFTIQSLMPNTMVSDISVTAFTSAGRGVTSATPDFTIPTTPKLRKCNTGFTWICSICLWHAAVLDVRVEQVSDSSVNVSWNALSNIPEVTGYRVYYSQIVRQAGEMSMDITDPSQDSVIIGNLESSVQYQFQAVAIAMLGGMELVSNRSVVNSDAVILITSPTISTVACEDASKPRTDTIATTAVVTLVLTIILYTTVLLVGCAVWRHSHIGKPK